MYYSNLKQVDKQLESYIKALEIHRKYSDNKEIEAALLGNIGSTLKMQGNYKDALKYNSYALEASNDDIAQGVANHNIGLIYNHLEKRDSAFIFFKRAYNLHQKGGDFQGMAAALIEQGKYYDENTQFERSQQLYLDATELINTNDIGVIRPYLYSTLAIHHQKRGNYVQAVEYGERAVTKAKQQQVYNDLEETYQLLETSYAAVKNFEKAFEIRGDYMAFKDSVSSTALLTKVESLKTEFEVEQTETENKFLKAKAVASEKTIQSRNITALALLLGLLLIGIVAFVIFRSNQQKQKYNEQLEATVATRTEELQVANHSLEQANYELRTFNYIASHDIKEPIRNIGNYAGLIFRKLPEDLKNSLGNYFETIKNSTSQLYTLVEDFAKYTTLSRNETLQKQDINLNELVQGLENIEASTEGYNGQIINHGLPTVHSNLSFVYTIFKNIINNGLKFNQSSTPTMELFHNETTTHHEITITDNGIGISEEFHEQIFEMFKRLHHRGEYEGSGIGLAIVKLAVDKIGGEVKIKSEVEKGSQFTISIPK